MLSNKFLSYNSLLDHEFHSAVILLLTLLSQSLEFPTMSLSVLAQLLEKENQCQYLSFQWNKVYMTLIIDHICKVLCIILYIIYVKCTPLEMNTV